MNGDMSWYHNRFNPPAEYIPANWDTFSEAFPLVAGFLEYSILVVTIMVAFSLMERYVCDELKKARRYRK